MNLAQARAELERLQTQQEAIEQVVGATQRGEAIRVVLAEHDALVARVTEADRLAGNWAAHAEERHQTAMAQFDRATVAEAALADARNALERIADMRVVGAARHQLENEGREKLAREVLARLDGNQSKKLPALDDHPGYDGDK